MKLALLSDGVSHRTKSNTPFAGLPLGEVMKSLPCPRLDIDDLQVRSLPTEEDRATHAAFVSALMRVRPALGSAAEGETLRSRIIKVLGQFRDQGTITLPPSKKTWERLHILAKMCAAAADWTSQSGPIVGASNALLEVKLDTTNVRRDLREMARWGLIVPFCPKGNGHRYYVPAKPGKAAAGAGWSLAPLVLMIDHLEAVAAIETELRELRVALPAEIKAHLNAMRSLVAPFVDAHSWAQELAFEIDRIAERRRLTARSSLTLMREILADARVLHERLQSAIIAHSHLGARDSRLSTTMDSTVRHQYNKNQSIDRKEGSAEGERREAAKDLRSCFKAEVQQHSTAALKADDAFGIRRSGFTWDEAPALFPFIRDFITLPSPPSVDSAHGIARVAGVTHSTAGLAIEKLGLEAALLCLLLTGQHSCDGEIRRSPEIYMRGLMHRAGNGDLNLGNSLFGLRSKIPGTSRARDRLNQNKEISDTMRP